MRAGQSVQEFIGVTGSNAQANVCECRKSQMHKKTSESGPVLSGVEAWSVFKDDQEKSKLNNGIKSRNGINAFGLSWYSFTPRTLIHRCCR
jgi:hypothetical protein